MYRHRRFFDRFFTIGTTTKDFTHRSLLLNIELDKDGRFNFTLSATSLIEGKSNLLNNPVFVSRINSFIKDIENIKDIADIINLQRQLSSFTDDFLPLEIRKYLLANKSLYDYLVIEDDSIDFNIPYGILFFPDKSDGLSISGKGYFLAELYTPIRAIQEKPSSKTDIPVSEIEKVCVLSTDDLKGSIQEEKSIIDYFNSKKNNIAVSIQDEVQLEKELASQNCNLYHFCCHGNNKCQIVTVKKGTPRYLDTDFFNLCKFPQNTTIFLNICSSNFTVYDGITYRSISKKLINREAELIIMTEWPINDSVAFRMGTEFYNRVIEKKESALSAIHNIKKSFTTIPEKLTAITYSLKGNPDMRLKIKE